MEEEEFIDFRALKTPSEEVQERFLKSAGNFIPVHQASQIRHTNREVRQDRTDRRSERR